jgi:hypothetical protein
LRTIASSISRRMAWSRATCMAYRSPRCCSRHPPPPRQRTMASSPRLKYRRRSSMQIG